MLSTFGLTHLALRVPDVEHAYGFYEAVFGMVAVYRSNDFIQAQTPGARDVLVFERAKGKGARVLNGPMEVPGGGRIVQLMDPQGAAFALFTSPTA